MLIPIRCFTCSNVLADKYEFYLQEVRKMKKGENRLEYLTSHNLGEKSVEGKVLDDLHLKNVCCRRHILTHVDIE